MPKRPDIKYLLYKLCFAAVLCGYFFVQTQSAYFTGTVINFAQAGSKHFLQKNDDGTAKPGANQARHKLNKRYQPVKNYAVLPTASVLKTPVVANAKQSPPLFCTIANCLHKAPCLRGPPSI